MFSLTKFVVKYLVLFYIRHGIYVIGSGKVGYGFKIFNGSVAVGNPLLKHVVYIKNGEYFCGGAILKPKIILTAAHCVALNEDGTKEEDNKMYIVAGTPFPEIDSPTSQVRYIRTTLIHKRYKNEEEGNDLAILVLRKALIENGDTVECIQLRRYPVAVGAICTIIGWGDTKCGEFGSKFADQAFYTEVMLKRTSYCKRYLPTNPGHICVLAINNASMTCPGDSGNPLICNGKLVGIHSMGTPSLGYPAILTNVQYFRKWIEVHLRKRKSKPFRRAANTKIVSHAAFFS